MTTGTAEANGAAQRRGRVWTIDAVRGLGMTTDVETAGAILGIGRSKAYQLAKADEFPVRLLRIGRRYVVPIPSILELLGVE
ncbi:hypothetical protein JCM9533A_78230 [Catenuloplanes niger JCM 9533]